VRSPHDLRHQAEDREPPHPVCDQQVELAVIGTGVR
jgi:hypothetical protein